MLIQCPNCGQEISPAAEMGKLKKTMTPEAIKARQENGRKGGRPKKIKAE